MSYIRLTGISFSKTDESIKVLERRIAWLTHDLEYNDDRPSLAKHQREEMKALRHSVKLMKQITSYNKSA